MLKSLLKQKFGIKAEEANRIRNFDTCRTSNHLYLLIPVNGIETEEIAELDSIAQHLAQYGDDRVCQFLKKQEEEYVIVVKNERYSILSQRTNRERSAKRLGRKLAKFHHRGRAISFQINKINRIGMWKRFWEQRLDQMEKAWNEHLFLHPENEFDRMFLETFPYYMGIAENGIQYLADTEIDGYPLETDNGTVCHERFSFQTWGDRMILKNPFDWVFDHSSRDLAEWTRERYFRNIKTAEKDIREFYADYRGFSPLSPFAWRLLYARLLFPLHYFECVEEYYTTASEQRKNELQERLNKYLNQTREHENFLGSFFQLAEVPVRRYQIPEPEWLKR